MCREYGKMPNILNKIILTFHCTPTPLNPFGTETKIIYIDKRHRCWYIGFCAKRQPPWYWLYVFHRVNQTPPFQHCLHMRNLDSDLDYLFIFICKRSQLPDAQCHINMACNQWLETWDVSMIYTGVTRNCVTVQWMSDKCMTLSPTKLNLIWTTAVNSRVMTWESQIQSWSFASVHPLHYFVAKTHNYLTVYDRW